MLKSYEELRKIDVTPYCDKRDNMLYLNWAKCIDLLHQNGAESAYFVPQVYGSTGSSLIMSDTEFVGTGDKKNRCYETRIEIHIDDKTYIMQSPVMNGSNPVQDNSMAQNRVWTSMCRSFVKGVAIYTGLGFDLWLKEEHENSKVTKQDFDHDIMQVRERLLEKVTSLNKRDMSLADIGRELGKTEDEIKVYLSQFKILQAFEYNLDRLLTKK